MFDPDTLWETIVWTIAIGVAFGMIAGLAVFG